MVIKQDSTQSQPKEVKVNELAQAQNQTNLISEQNEHNVDTLKSTDIKSSSKPKIKAQTKDVGPLKKTVASKVNKKEPTQSIQQIAQRTAKPFQIAPKVRSEVKAKKTDIDSQTRINQQETRAKLKPKTKFPVPVAVDSRNQSLNHVKENTKSKTVATEITEVLSATVYQRNEDDNDTKIDVINVVTEDMRDASDQQNTDQDLSAASYSVESDIVLQEPLMQKEDRIISPAPAKTSFDLINKPATFESSLNNEETLQVIQIKEDTPIAEVFDIAQRRIEMVKPEKVLEIEGLIDRVAAILFAPIVENSIRTESGIGQVNELVEIDQATVQKLEETFTEIFDALGIECTHEMVQSIVQIVIARKDVFLKLSESQQSTSELGTREVLTYVAQALSNFKQILEVIHTILGRIVLAAS